MDEVGSSEVGLLGMVSLLEEVVLALLGVKGGTVKAGSRFLPPMWVPVWVFEVG